MKNIILTFLITFSSVNYSFCQTVSDTTFDFKYFSLRTTKEWKIVRFRGIDSYVGGLTNGIDTLHFDYGPYSAEIDCPNDDCKASYSIQNWRIAKFARQKENKFGLTAIRLKRQRNTWLIIFGHNLTNEKEAITIFKTLKFL